jgi:hypothetical protein
MNAFVCWFSTLANSIRNAIFCEAMEFASRFKAETAFWLITPTEQKIIVPVVNYECSVHILSVRFVQCLRPNRDRRRSCRCWDTFLFHKFSVCSTSIRALHFRHGKISGCYHGQQKIER